MALTMTVRCHPATGTGGTDSADMALKLQQIHDLLSQIKDGVIQIDPSAVINANIDLETVENLLQGLIDTVGSKLDAIAETNNAIKLSLGETVGLLNNVNFTVEGIKGAINSLSPLISDSFQELFGRWDSIFGMIKSEFDEMQALQGQTRDAQLQANVLISEIKDQLTNKAIEEIPLSLKLNANVDITNKVEVVIPAGASSFQISGYYLDCALVDADSNQYLFEVDQELKDGSMVKIAEVERTTQANYDKPFKAYGNIIAKAPKTIVTIVKSHARFSIEAIYLQNPGAPITVTEVEVDAVEGVLGEEEVVDIDAEPIAETPTEPVTEEPPTDPVAEEPPTEPVTEEPPTEPVTEEPPTDPVAEEPPTDPVAEEPPTDPVVEEPPTDPTEEPPLT
ncbi:MAG: hypothetical protein QNJ27_05780 [Simkaniaceae bacterium]|nr:hypothetical protein [Simkaniaceae bacterium]